MISDFLVDREGDGTRNQQSLHSGVGSKISYFYPYMGKRCNLTCPYSSEAG